MDIYGRVGQGLFMLHTQTLQSIEQLSPEGVASRGLSYTHPPLAVSWRLVTDSSPGGGCRELKRAPWEGLGQITSGGMAR